MAFGSSRNFDDQVGYQLSGNSRLYSQLIALVLSPSLSHSVYLRLCLSDWMVSAINQFVKKNALRCGKSIPINIKQTLNCLSALTNRATRQHKYHMTSPKEEALVLFAGCWSPVVVAIVAVVVSISRQHIYHLLRTKCFPQTCKRCQGSDRRPKKNSCSLSTVGSRLFAVCCWLLAVVRCLLSVGCCVYIKMHAFIICDKDLLAIKLTLNDLCVCVRVCVGARTVVGAAGRIMRR